MKLTILAVIAALIGVTLGNPLVAIPNNVDNNIAPSFSYHFSYHGSFPPDAENVNAVSLMDIDDLMIYEDNSEHELDDFVQAELLAQQRGFFSFLTKFYWVLKSALRSLKGLNCAIKEVVAIKQTAQDFPNDILACGVAAGKELQNVINSCKDIVNTSNNIINSSETICNMSDYNEDTQSSSKTPGKCFWKVLGQMLTLNQQIKNTIKLIKKVPSVPGDAGTCVNNTLTNLTNKFTQFPQNVYACSKLTSRNL